MTDTNATAQTRLVLSPPGWAVLSHDNGQAYEVHRAREPHALLFAGAEARAFEAELDALVTPRHDPATGSQELLLSEGDALACLWHDHMTRVDLADA